MLSSFSQIGLAEIGDKSQLVCMALAVRYRAGPVLLGAIAAFILLNLVAVLLGAMVAQWLPERVVATVVGIMFLLFGIHALRNHEDDDVSDASAASSVFFSTLLLITVAEFGDKTQIAVAGLASAAEPMAVWVGATAALILTSALGVWAGRTLLQRIPIVLLHRFSGALFILFGLFALARAV